MRGLMSVKSKALLGDKWKEHFYLLRERSATLSWNHGEAGEAAAAGSGCAPEAPPTKPDTAIVEGVYDLPDRAGKRPHRMDVCVAGQGPKQQLLCFAVETAGEKRRWVAALASAGQRLPLAAHPLRERLEKQLGPGAAQAAHDADDAAIKAAQEAALQDAQEEKYYAQLQRAREEAAALKAAAGAVWACYCCGNRRSRHGERCMDCNRPKTTLEERFDSATAAADAAAAAAAVADASDADADANAAARRAFVARLRDPAGGLAVQKVSQKDGRKVQARGLRLGGAPVDGEEAPPAAASAAAAPAMRRGSSGGDGGNEPTVLLLGKKSIPLASVLNVCPAAPPPGLIQTGDSSAAAAAAASAWLTVTYPAEEPGGSGSGGPGPGGGAAPRPLVELVLGLECVAQRDEAVAALRALAPVLRAADKRAELRARKLGALGLALRRARVGRWLDQQPEQAPPKGSGKKAKKGRASPEDAEEAAAAAEEAAVAAEAEAAAVQLALVQVRPAAEAMMPEGLLAGTSAADAALRLKVLRLLGALEACGGALADANQRDLGAQTAVCEQLGVPHPGDDAAAMHMDEIMQLRDLLATVPRK